MAKTFSQMVAEAMAEVPAIDLNEAHTRRQQDPQTLVIDPRDAEDISVTGIIPGAMNISYGALTYKADNELPTDWLEPELADRSRPIIMPVKAANWRPSQANYSKTWAFQMSPSSRVAPWPGKMLGFQPSEVTGSLYSLYMAVAIPNWDSAIGR